MFTLGPPFWGGGESDPLFASVLALLHLNDGAGVGAPFVDSSLYSGVQQGVPLLATTTADARFGAGSLQRSAGTDATTGWPAAGSGILWKTVKSIAIPANAPMTLELWAKVPAIAAGGSKLLRVFFRNGLSPTVDYDINWTGSDGGNVWTCNRNDSTVAVSGVDLPPHATFKHLALSVTPGGNGYFFIDGVQIGSAFAVAASAAANEVGVTLFAADVFGVAAAILVDEVRVTSAARYASAFTPRIEEFPNS